MKLVFAHDHKLRKISGKYYTLGGLSDRIMGRYLRYFDNLTILCRAISKQRYDTQLFEIKDSRITIKPVSNGSLILKRDALKMLEREIQSADALIVKLHSVIAEYAIFFARKYRKPYLVELVGDPWDAYWNHSIKGKIVAPFMTLLTALEVKSANYVLYVTNRYLEKKYPTKGKWVACSDVEIAPIEQIVLDKRLAKIRGMENKFIIGTLAQVDVAYKGQEYVIRALAKLNDKRILYRMAGSGNNKRLLRIAEKYGVRDQIEFSGVLSHEQVFFWLDDIDFYIQPSLQEGLPRAIAEAMSRAVPVSGSDVGGIGELVCDDYVFKKKNVDEIVLLISHITQDELEIQAKRSFETAKNYEKGLLESKRNKFYNDFFESCKTKSW